MTSVEVHDTQQYQDCGAIAGGMLRDLFGKIECQPITRSFSRQSDGVRDDRNEINSRKRRDTNPCKFKCVERGECNCPKSEEGNVNVLCYGRWSGDAFVRG